MYRTQIRLLHNTRLALNSTTSKMSSGNQSHAVNSQTQSAVPDAVQRNAPKGLEEALPDSVRVACSSACCHCLLACRYRAPEPGGLGNRSLARSTRRC